MRHLLSSGMARALEYLGQAPYGIDSGSSRWRWRAAGRKNPVPQGAARARLRRETRDWTSWPWVCETAHEGPGGDDPSGTLKINKLASSIPHGPRLRYDALHRVPRDCLLRARRGTRTSAGGSTSGVRLAARGRGGPRSGVPESTSGYHHGMNSGQSRPDRRDTHTKILKALPILMAVLTLGLRWHPPAHKRTPIPRWSIGTPIRAAKRRCAIW